MNAAVPLLAAALLPAACGERPAPDAQAGAQPAASTHCYIQVTRHDPVVADNDTFPGPVDSLYIRLDLVGNLANGVYDQFPGEHDPMTGTFTGTLEDGVITALYNMTTGGEEVRQEVLFRLTGTGLRVGHGELIEDQGIRLFKDKALATYGEEVPAVPCP